MLFNHTNEEILLKNPKLINGNFINSSINYSLNNFSMYQDKIETQLDNYLIL